MKALVCLTPWEAKRLIAKGIASDIDIQECFENNRILIARGIHCAYLIEELTGKILEKNKFAAGMVSNTSTKRLGGVDPSKRLPELMIEKGEVKEVQITTDLVRSLDSGDLIIKSANALDTEYVPAILASHPTGGTYGAFWPTALARGITVICPVSLERLVIDSVLDSAGLMGISEIDLSMGAKCGLLPMAGAIVFTEIDALETLFPELTVTHVASGGLGRGGEGSVTLLLEGEEEEDVQAAFDLIQKIIVNEKPLDPF